MAMAVILEAIRDQIRTDLSLGADQCRVMPNGEPVGATMSPIFVGVDESSQPETGNADFLREEHIVNVFCWRRAEEFPDDMKESLLLNADPHNLLLESIATLARQVIQAIHKNETLRAAINTTLGVPSGSVGDKILTPAILTGVVSTKRKPINDGDEGEPPVWFVRQLTFGGFLRVQSNTVLG